MKQFAILLSLIFCLGIGGNVQAQTCPCKTRLQEIDNENYPPPLSETDMEDKAMQLVRGLESLMQDIVNATQDSATWEEIQQRYVNPILSRIVPGATMETCAIKNGVVTRIYQARPYRKYFKRLYDQAASSEKMRIGFSEVKVVGGDMNEVSFQIRFNQDYRRDYYEDETIKITKVCFCHYEKTWVPYLGSTRIDRTQNRFASGVLREKKNKKH